MILLGMHYVHQLEGTANRPEWLPKKEGNFEDKSRVSR